MNTGWLRFFTFTRLAARCSFSTSDTTEAALVEEAGSTGCSPARGSMWKRFRSPKSRRESAGTLDQLGASIPEATMSRWTDEELRELAALWPTHSMSELVELLHRPRWSIRSKARRLRLDGLRPHNSSEDFEAVTRRNGGGVEDRSCQRNGRRT